jgi:hypothetical protein
MIAAMNAAAAAPFALGALSLAVPFNFALPSGQIYIHPLFWRVPTTAANGTVRRMTVLSPTAIVKQGTVTASNGFFDLADTNPVGVVVGDKRLAIFDDWAGDPADLLIRGGPAIATLTDL